jgi:hypothetical protein
MRPSAIKRHAVLKIVSLLPSGCFVLDKVGAWCHPFEPQSTTNEVASNYQRSRIAIMILQRSPRDNHLIIARSALPRLMAEYLRFWNQLRAKYICN